MWIHLLTVLWVFCGQALLCAGAGVCFIGSVGCTCFESAHIKAWCISGWREGAGSASSRHPADMHAAIGHAVQSVASKQEDNIRQEGQGCTVLHAARHLDTRHFGAACLLRRSPSSARSANRQPGLHACMHAEITQPLCTNYATLRRWTCHTPERAIGQAALVAPIPVVHTFVCMAICAGIPSAYT